MNAESAVNITLYDMSGAPLHPDVVREITLCAEKIAKRDKLLVNVIRG